MPWCKTGGSEKLISFLTVFLRSFLFARVLQQVDPTILSSQYSICIHNVAVVSRCRGYPQPAARHRKGNFKEIILIFYLCVHTKNLH